MTTASAEYRKFLERKSQWATDAGFDPLWVPDFLFDFQRHLVTWAIRRGRAAIFADCGLGKTAIEIVWAENVVRNTNRPVLILTPLAVAQQFVSEGRKFGVEVSRTTGGRIDNPGIYVTNYERLHLLDSLDFAGVACDESQAIKNFDGVRTALVTDFMRRMPYRLLCTATAAPNDYVEIGTSSEAIGELGHSDMITRFFRQSTQKDHLGWGRTKYVLRTHAETDFWRWVCSWARAIRKPSDLGFDDSRFILPPLQTNVHEVRSRESPPGCLFDNGAKNLFEQRQEQRRTLIERCETAAELVANSGKPAVCWCHLNDEGDELTRMIPGAVQVSGSDSDDVKEERLAAFSSGAIRVLVTKPKIAGYGLNWQHCAHQTYFPSHSFEQWYQGVRRSWRFGQLSPVVIDMITTDGGVKVIKNLQEKSAAAERMFAELVRLMNDQFTISRTKYGDKLMEVPSWL